MADKMLLFRMCEKRIKYNPLEFCFSLWTFVDFSSLREWQNYDRL